MNIIAIIQARMDSKRLPGKVFISINKKPILWHVVNRVAASKLIDEIVIATSTKKIDNIITKFASKYHLKVFRGSENDCLDRFYMAAKKFNANIVVRVTSDCPLICPEIIDRVISEFLKGGYDYITNTLIYTYPEGCDVEVFSFKAIEKAWKECKDPVNREHVTPYIRNSEKFKVKNIKNKNPIDYQRYKWSVDRIDDLKFVKKVYRYLYKEGKIFSYKKIMELLEKHPEIEMINSKEVINEGYYRSIIKSPKVKPKKMKITESLNLREKAKEIIPNCSQTFSKSVLQFVQGVAPVFLDRGDGSHVWDVDGNEYIDYAMALGPIILGHNYSKVTSEVNKILKKGTTFTLPHSLEIKLAELLCDIIPCAEMVRFGKNGSDATSGAVRVARAYTGRDKIICCGYHGWQDWFIASTTRNKGIPKTVQKLTLTFKYNNIRELKKLFSENKNQVACVIMEPVSIIEPQKKFLQDVKDITHKNGSILIFDEVVTGFRLSLGGAQEYFKVVPDLACFGKAMGNGFPVSAIVGNRKIMKLFEEVFYSFTFGGEIVSIAAAIATIRELKERGIIQHLWEKGRVLKDGYNILAKEISIDEYTQCIGYPPRTIITFKNKKGGDDLLLKSLFQQECINRGILFTGGHNICYSHSSKDIDYTLRVYQTVLEIIKKAINKNLVRKMIKGKPVQPIFRRV